MAEDPIQACIHILILSTRCRKHHSANKLLCSFLSELAVEFLKLVCALFPASLLAVTTQLSDCFESNLMYTFHQKRANSE